MVMQEKKPSEHFEIGMEKENGEIVWTSTMAVPVPISDWAALCAAMDITEERKMEESLRITNTAIEDSITAIAINDLEGNLTYVNSAALNMWGYKKEEALGKHAREFWKYPKKIDEVIDALFKIGSWSGDMVGKKKDGSIFDIYLSANIARNAARKPLCLVSSSLDITDRKKMERELKEREERFRKIFELSPIGIQLFDVEGFLVSANQASQKIMGVTDTVKHKRHNIFRDVLKDAESQLKLLSGQIITEGAWIKINPEKAVKLQKLDKDALPNKIERIYIENIAATLGEANKPDGYICIQRDLTEHRLASEAMMSENERLQIIYDIWKTRVKTSDLRMND
jgi:PAS domain S-box-containing protein